jgi:hypothetical protein
MLHAAPSHFRRWQFCLASILTPVVLFALGCGKEDKTITSASSQYEVEDDRSSPPPPSSPPAPEQGVQGDQADRGAPPPPRGNGSDIPPATTPGGAPQQPPSIPQTALDDFAVPDGTPDELWSFIEDVSRREPRGRTQQEILRSVQEIMSARIGAAEKILEHPDATTEQRRNSVEVKLATLQELMGIGVVEAEDHFKEFCRALVNDQDSEIARYGRLLNFALDVNEVVTNETDAETGGADEIVARARDLLSEEVVDNETFQYVRASALELLQGGYPAEGQQIVDELVTTFADETDEQIRRDVRSLPEEAFFLKSELPQKLTNFVQRQPGSLEPLLAATRELLEQDRMGTTALQQAVFIADAMERHGETEAAREVYSRVTEVFSSSEDEEAARLAVEATESAERRLGMVGQPFSLTGKLSDGSELDWEEFREGNVVLVTFWSIENRAYVQQEIPQIKELAELYADRGFRVVGVNVDEEPELLQQFFRFQSVPWPNVMDGTAGEGQMVKQVGVATIPFNILVDREGNVTALHLNSQSLPEKLLDVLN